MRTKVVAVVVPDGVRELMKSAAEKTHKGNVAQWVRTLIAQALNLSSIELQERGGYRPNSGRKPSVPAIRSAAEKLSARSRFSPQKYRRRSAQ